MKTKIVNLFKKKARKKTIDKQDVTLEDISTKVPPVEQEQEDLTQQSENVANVDTVVPIWQRAFMLYVVLGVMIIASAFLVIHQSFIYRQEYQIYNELKQEEKELNVEWGRMLIEKQTFGSTGQIATRAVEQLHMYSPTGKQYRVVTLPENPPK